SRGRSRRPALANDGALARLRALFSGLAAVGPVGHEPVSQDDLENRLPGVVDGSGWELALDARSTGAVDAPADLGARVVGVVASAAQYVDHRREHRGRLLLAHRVAPLGTGASGRSV